MRKVLLITIFAILIFVIMTPDAHATPSVILGASPTPAVVGDTVTLSASITDPGCPACTPSSFSYAWTLVSRPIGSSAALSSTSVANPTFTPDLPGNNYQVSLVVTDTLGQSSAPTSLTIPVSECGTCAPTVSPTASPNPASINEPVILDANPSDAGCPACIPLFSYHWTMSSAPAGSAATLSDPTIQMPTITPDSAGSYQFSVIATDSLGQSSTPQFVTLTVNPPDTIIISGPLDGTITGPSVTFSFTSDVAAATFQCKLDTGEFSSCTSGQTFSGLTGGSHTFEVRAVDCCGNTDPTPAQVTWQVDAMGPTVTITNPPDGFVTGPSIDLTFTTGDTTPVTFQCTLDGGAFSPCSSTTMYDNLSGGAHTVIVQGFDIFGNPGPTSSVTWIVNTMSISDVSVLEGNSGTTDAIFTVTLSNPSSQVVTFDFATADGTATVANNDYVPSSSTMMAIAAGQTTHTIHILINGDTTNEPNETFFVNISGANHAVITKAQGVGIILNDDPPPKPPILSVDSTTIDFGSVNVGSSTSRLVTITNTGGSDLTFSAPSLTTGADAGFSISTPPILSLGPSDSTTFSVSFKPVNPGPQTGSILISSNGGTSTISLKGQVKTPAQATQDLISFINSLNLDHGITSSLDSKLNAALASLNSNQDNTAKNQLKAFENYLQSQRQFEITQAIKNQMMTTVQNIINSIH